jgi:pantoate--beta-alanine ligase
MQIINTKKELSILVNTKRLDRKGLVPTMGALHEGHISLLKKAREENEIVICSLFVNPTQFTKAYDLANYPRSLSEDLTILSQEKVDYAFVPSAQEIYDKPSKWHMELGNLENKLEGVFRPGHFQGVSQIVKILLDLTKPQNAYFGQKDFQQFLVIQKLVRDFNLSVNLVCCPIIREKDGLAMSSRNLHLTKIQREKAPLIFKALCTIQKNKDNYTPEQCIQIAKDVLEEEPIFRMEYLEIVEGETLETIKNWQEPSHAVALIAVNLGETRLIDNIKITY